jgi:hypothetical protein
MYIVFGSYDYSYRPTCIGHGFDFVQSVCISACQVKYEGDWETSHHYSIHTIIHIVSLEAKGINFMYKLLKVKPFCFSPEDNLYRCLGSHVCINVFSPSTIHIPNSSNFSMVMVQLTVCCSCAGFRAVYSYSIWLWKRREMGGRGDGGGINVIKARE